MASSRTGSSKYLAARAQVIREARANGLTHCPGYQTATGRQISCGLPLDYENSGLPNSAETDHIIRVEHGGSDTVDNLRVLCRKCNRQRQAKQPPPAGNQYATGNRW